MDIVWRHASGAMSLALGVALAGCSATCAPASWQIEFDGRSLERDTASVTVRVRAGTCASPGAVLLTRSLVRGGMRSSLPSLGPGPFALEATALDENCVVIGRACDDVAAASCPAQIQQDIAGVSAGAPSCAGCVAGLCPESLDAGPPEIDAGVSGDGSVRADGADCMPAETRCGDAKDDDCDGRTDCEDSDCEGMSGTCGGLCRGGACCNGCWNGESCEDGDSRSACGTAGESCDACRFICGCHEGRCDC